MTHVTYFCMDCWDPPIISREPFKLGNSNLACRVGLIVMCCNEKDGKLGQGVVKRSRDLLLKFWDPIHISAMVEAGNFKFGMRITTRGFNEKMQN